MLSWSLGSGIKGEDTTRQVHWPRLVGTCVFHVAFLYKPHWGQSWTICDPESVSEEKVAGR